ncbi:MAG: DUF4389 domain-containing protein [Ornithinimicrobium sp.]
MKPERIVALVVGILVGLPALAVLGAAGTLVTVLVLARDDDGYLEVAEGTIQSSTLAVTASDVALNVDSATPHWVMELLDADVRVQVTNLDQTRPVFVGVGPSSDVSAYLAGSAHDRITEWTDGQDPVLQRRNGETTITAPGQRGFWEVQSSGTGTQALTWSATSGRWSAVVMNADGSPGISAQTRVDIRAGVLSQILVVMLVVGLALLALAVTLIVIGVSGPRPRRSPALASGEAGQHANPPDRAHPVQLSSTLDPTLSRWLWLVKWFLAIPHVIVLFFLWIAFLVLTVAAGFAILFTGTYPRSIFDFNTGVLRWSWRVSYYASTGGLGTDHYPPFTLHAQPGDPAQLDITYPPRLSRALVLIKWWLLAIPHYLILGLLLGSVRWDWVDNRPVNLDPTGGGGVLGLLVLIAAIMMLFTGAYPRALFDLIIGLNRWLYRVIAYAALMTDSYPPFRLDQGGTETPTPPTPPPPAEEPQTATPDDSKRQLTR